MLLSFTAKNCKVAKQGTIVAGIYIILWAGAMTLAGMFAMVLLPDISSQNALSEKNHNRTYQHRSDSTLPVGSFPEKSCNHWNKDTPRKNCIGDIQRSQYAGGFYEIRATILSNGSN